MAKKLDFQRGDQIASKYEVVDRLEESPLGITYRVKHLKSGLYVRLTMLHPDVASRERKTELIEAFKIAKSTKHPNLPRVGELKDHDGVAYVTHEDFEGQTLRDLITEYQVAGKPFALREAAQIVTQLLDTLKTLHDQGLVYRALRPEYILVHLKRTGPRGANVVVQLRLTNVGFWDLVNTGMLAEDEFTRGEAQYLAPELKSFNPDPTVRSDIYSAGVIFYELLVGSAPVGTFQLPRQRRPDLPQHVDFVIENALANSPGDRYPSVEDFITNIGHTFDQAMAEPERTGPAVPIAAWGLAALLVVAIGAIVWLNKTDPYEQALLRDSEITRQIFDDIRANQPSTADVRAILAKHPKNMVYIPEGPYLRGKLHSEVDVKEREPVAQRAELDAFLIDAFEYPNLQGGEPKIGVTFGEAEAMCEEAGKRLCTADELEKACKGQQSEPYGYGESYDPDLCGGDKVHLSGQLGDCRSDWGVYDISGNFREWTSTLRPGTEDRRLVKGGDPKGPERGARCAYSTDLSQGFTDDTISFRCCRDADAPPVDEPAEDATP